jgi:hypothetical protein
LSEFDLVVNDNVTYLRLQPFSLFHFDLFQIFIVEYFGILID